MATAQEPTPPEAEAPPSGPEVTAVRFPGAISLDRGLLEGAISTQATSCRSPLFLPACLLGIGWALEEAYLDAEQVPLDAERLEMLYEIWGYPDARVTSRIIPDGEDQVVVEFTIEEGEPILVASLEVRGLTALAPPVQLPELLPLREGEPYALPRLETTRDWVREAFADRGRPFAEVEVSGDVDEVAKTARVVLTVVPGPAAVFGPVTIEAEAPIDEEVIRERLEYRPGDPYSPAAIARTEEALYEIPVVARATIEPVDLDAPTAPVPTRITVEAARVQGIEVEGTVSSTECLEAAGFWRNRYFLGGPRVFSLGVGVSNLFAGTVGGGFPCTSAGEGEFAELDYFVQAELREPWPGSPRTSVLARGFFERESSPRAFVQRGYGAELAVARRFGRGLTASVGYSPQRNELDAAELYFCGNFGVCSAEGIAELSDFTWLAPVELFAVWRPFPGPIDVFRARERNIPEWARPPEPVLRYAASGGFEVAAAPTGSEYRYVRGIVEGTATRALGPSFELAARTRLGALTGAEIMPPQLRLYSGGVNTVRGVSQNLLGPKFLITAAENLSDLGCEPRPDGCPPGVVVDADQVGVRPTGGQALLEANAEVRTWVTQTLQLAAFLDYGVLWRDPFDDSEGGAVGDGVESLLSPGVGLRIITGLGPIRIDLGYNPSGSRAYPLFTEDPATGELIPLGDVVYAPFERGDPGFFGELWRRLQLHVAIGQPF